MFPVLEPLRVAVKEAFGIETPTAVQDVAMSTLLDADKKGDVIIRARTGSGKTLGFLLPILHTLLSEQAALKEKVSRDSLGTVCLIVVPTRELAVQTGQVLEKLLAKLKGPLHWIVSGTLTGGDKRKSEKARLRKTLHIVVATPGRLLDHLSTTQAWSEKCRKSLRWLVVDEADRLMDMGFEKKMKEVAEKLGISGYYRFSRLILCSATLKDGTEEFAGMKLKEPVFASPAPEQKKTANAVAVTSEFNAPAHLQQKFIAAPTKLRFAALLGLLKSLFASKENTKVVLFTICCDSVDYFYRLLQWPALKDAMPDTPLSVYRLHGSLDQKERISAFKDFVSSTDRSLLVCTDVAARGLNLERVTAIIQYDAPCDVNDYLHRAGRTARQAESGQSFLFLMPSEKEYVGVLRERGMAIGSASWDPLVQWVKTVKVETTRKVTKKEVAKETKVEEEEEGAEKLDQNLRAKFSAWQENFESNLKSDDTLTGLAKTAYLATVRAYATHSSTEKHIFHVKRLHLGHLASTFGMAQPPTAFSAAPKAPKFRQGSESTEKGGDRSGVDRSAAKYRRSDGNNKGSGPARNNSKGNNARNTGPMKKKRSAPVSEFGAGDISAFFSSAKKPKRA